MAYDFIPTTPTEVYDKIKDPVIAKEIAETLVKLQGMYSAIKDPLTIDIAKPLTFNITRKLTGTLDIKTIQAGLKRTKVKFGEGSRGGRGTQNKGNLFEYELATDFDNWWKGEPISSAANETLIKEIVEKYKVKEWKTFYVDAEGAENKPRPLQINGNNILVSPGLQPIGDVVTDITLRKSKDSDVDAVYLSLKFSGTVTFFNSGTKKYLTDAELNAGLIKNVGGLALLKMFGLDNATFCSVFNNKGKGFKSFDTTREVDTRVLSNLIKSGIGYGFHMVHKIGQQIISKEVDKQYRDEASRIQKVMVYYGGKTGTGKRVDIEVTTPKYILKFNFRNKQGGNFISHLMCDYSYRK